MDVAQEGAVKGHEARLLAVLAQLEGCKGLGEGEGRGEGDVRVEGGGGKGGREEEREGGRE